MPANFIELLTTPDYRQIKQRFLQELTIASQGYPSSLSYIRHQLPTKPIITTGLIQTIVIGGTNFVITLVQVSPDGSKRAISSRQGIIPQLDSKETFLNFIKEHFNPKVVAVAINLGFPMQPDIGAYGEIDSKILYGVKEQAFHGLIGVPIGQYLRQQLQIEIPISVANDTVCLALAGTGKEDGGFVLGSGCNMSIMSEENGKRIVANLESCNFSKFDPTPGLEAIDAVSPTRGKNRFEKLISGIYLPMHFNYMAKKYNIVTTPVANGKEITSLALNNSDITGDLARGVLERSASLAATQFAAVHEFMDNPKHLDFIVEGSLFRDGWDFEKNVQRRLQLLGVAENTFSFNLFDDSSTKGAIGLLTI